jgi:hypothetical protein
MLRYLGIRKLWLVFLLIATGVVGSLVLNLQGRISAWVVAALYLVPQLLLLLVRRRDAGFPRPFPVHRKS